ncbi:hypothetical protein J4Q44_G00308910 [Coregonus suidteri]|uniref:Uncharacterized protein n=1 Tax=Coregonus suidteri TaxID=861788 RepID=A0AAN8L534_9TELE
MTCASLDMARTAKVGLTIHSAKKVFQSLGIMIGIIQRWISLTERQEVVGSAGPFPPTQRCFCGWLHCTSIIKLHNYVLNSRQSVPCLLCYLQDRVYISFDWTSPKRS